ncbi:MAG: DNA gyrase modulator, partial [Crocosphaera sp.]
MSDLANYQNILTDLISKNRDRVDYLAIRLETSQGTSIMLRGDKIDTLSEGISTGGQVRACYKGGWGFATFNQLSTLPQRIEEAMASARLVGEDETILAPIAPIQASCQLPLTRRDPRQVPLAEKKALCDHYNDILRRLSDQITTTS